MKKYLKNSILVVALLASICRWAKAESAMSNLPKGWRLPTKAELKEKWRDSDSSRFASIKGDFDGDKKIDQAIILVSTNEKKYGIFVWWGANKVAKPIQVFVENNISLLQIMGIKLYKSGTAKTACGKGYFECPKGDSGEITLTHDAIDYFKYESADSIFHWDIKKKSFERTWMSD